MDQPKLSSIESRRRIVPMMAPARDHGFRLHFDRRPHDCGSDIARDRFDLRPKHFEFWRSDQVDAGHCSVLRDPSTTGGGSIQQVSADRAARSSEWEVD